MNDPILAAFAPEKLKADPPKRVSSNLSRGFTADPKLLAVKIALTEEQREKVALQNAQARGELLLAATVEREWSTILRSLRGALLAIPTRLAQRGLSAHDVGLVDQELRDVLSELGQ